MGFQITGLPEADAVLDEYPLALVIGMQLDQQYGIEHAFRGGWKILTRFGTLDTGAIAAADPERFSELCRTPPAIHRFPAAKATAVQKLATLVEDSYAGDPARIWTEATTGDDLLKRLKQLPAFGPQTSKIFVALIGKQLGVRPEGWEAAAGDYALPGYRSVADVVDAESLTRVRDYKKQKKAAAKAAATPA
ncbi:HhH-GPD-type base excision DNA repair protein [Spongisporangium articulatum]|uniref:HhH-GPD-type base excision DNA repair protein n=1 Tax=Spongisporangium articulatum TaxID=3362603 RepID=A0ABW8AMF4_9ACTN